MSEDDQPSLFEPPPPSRERRSKAPHKEAPIDKLWTKSKALLIERYLYYFVLITKHGNYIDGFAGPQDSDHPESWAARAVLETNPQWLRHFYLFDRDEKAVQALTTLKEAHADRDVVVVEGDFNATVDSILTPERMAQKEAAFCLLDQRTFECHWETVKRIAAYKAEAHFKIELFYFLAHFWLNRAFAATSTPEGEAKIAAWWGRDDWVALRAMRGIERAEVLAKRMREELGYTSAEPFAIYNAAQGSQVMYYMVHASDHPEAPKLMSRAYRKAVYPKEELAQVAMDLGMDT